MKITVKFHSVLPNIAGVETDTLEVNGFADALVKIEDKYGSRIRGFYNLGKEVNLRDFCIFMINDTIVNLHQAEKTVLQTGDEFHILPPVAGG